jgi:branched-chain amino acid transport system permease protein
VGGAVVVVLNLQVLQGLSLWLSVLRQSDPVIPIINFAWKDLSNQIDPAKYQRLLFGLTGLEFYQVFPANRPDPEREKVNLIHLLNRDPLGVIRIFSVLALFLGTTQGQHA